MEKHLYLPPCNTIRFGYNILPNKEIAYMKIVVCLIAVFVFSHGIWAQTTRTISGTIKDGSGNGVGGVTILAEATGVQTISSELGIFSIPVPEGDQKLLITAVNYTEQTVQVNSNQNTVEVVLSTKVISIDEVIVVGYGTQKKESVVGAITQIKGDVLKKAGGVSTVSEALQGAIPGLTAINSNGKPGADAASLYIRGNANPFVLVDGVERNLNQIDPNEIENISVLKDASATAVYGTRGANGVILITTKRGRIGKPEFGFTANFGFKTPTEKPEYADYITTMEMYNEAAMNDKLYDRIIPESIISAWRQNISNAGPNNQYFPQVDWWDELVKKVGYQQNYNLNARGGSQFMKYFVSVGYLNDGDIYKTQPNDEFDPRFRVQRYNWRSNFDFDITKSTLFSINFSGNFRYRNQPGYRIDDGLEDGYGQDEFFTRIVGAPRNLFPLQFQDGKLGESTAGQDNMYLAINEGGQRVYKYFQGFYDAELKQRLDFITKGLSVKGKVSYTSGSSYQRSILRDGIAGSNFTLINIIRYFRSYDLTSPQTDATGNVTYPLLIEQRWPSDQTQEGIPLTSNGESIYEYERDLYYEFSTNYARRFKNHDVNALALFNRRALIAGGLGSTIGIGEYGEDWVGRLTYGFKNKYLAEFNGSYTGSSKFAQGKRFGFFPSYALGWVLTKEKFFEFFVDKNIINNLKVRYNWGVVGSDRGVPANQFLQTYGSTGGIRLGDINFISYGPIYLENITANINNTWEKATKQNIGVDFTLFKKLSGFIDFFEEDRKDILIGRRTIPRAFGNIVPRANIGQIKSHGFEFELGWNDKMNNGLGYFVNLNYSWNENRVVFWDDAVGQFKYLKNAGKPNGTPLRHIINDNYSSLDDIYNYAPPQMGTPQANIIPGDFMYIDYNADGVIDGNDRVPMPFTTRPLKTASINAGLNYKGFSMNLLIYGASDVYRTIHSLYLWDFNNGFLNGQSNITERASWDYPGSAVKPALHITNTNHNQNTSSTYNYVDNSYIRLKTAEISYDINKNWIQRTGLKSLLFYVNGNNLLTFKKYDYPVDPETAGANVYPIVKRFNIGLRSTF